MGGYDAAPGSLKLQSTCMHITNRDIMVHICFCLFVFYKSCLGIETVQDIDHLRCLAVMLSHLKINNETVSIFKDIKDITHNSSVCLECLGPCQCIRCLHREEEEEEV